MQINDYCGSGFQPVALETVEEEQFVLGMFTEGARNKIARFSDYLTCTLINNL